MNLLFSPDHQITLIDCDIKDYEDETSDAPSDARYVRAVRAKLSRFASNLQPGIYQLKENAVTPVCQIDLPEWAISDEPLIFLEPIELEIIFSY